MESSNKNTANSIKFEQHEERNTLQQLGGIYCQVCHEAFRNRKQFDLHYTSQHVGQAAVYSCLLCFREFSKYKTFHDHCYRHVSGKRMYCVKCQKQFSIETFKLHMAIFHDEQMKLYECRQCSKECASFSELAQHSRHCSPAHECDICYKSFTHKCKLLTHMQHHSERRDFKCELCDARFKIKRSLVVHHKLQHENNNKYKCGLCTKIFGTSTKLQFHMNMHTGNRPFRCDHCNSTFAHNSNRIKHMERKHSVRCHHAHLTLIEEINSVGGNGEPNSSDENQSLTSSNQIEVTGIVHTNGGSMEFTCSVCSVQFKTRVTWLRHIKRSHLKYKYRCNDCAKIITCPKPIEAYDDIPLIDSVKPFICDYCESGFTDKFSLVRHISRAGHMAAASKYKCSTCDIQFYSAHQLSNHKKVHNTPAKVIKTVISLTRKNEPPKVFMCQYCDKTFGYHRSRARHVKLHHGVAPKPKNTNNHSEFAAFSPAEFMNAKPAAIQNNINQVKRQNLTAPIIPIVQPAFALPNEICTSDSMTTLNMAIPAMNMVTAVTDPKNTQQDDLSGKSEIQQKPIDDIDNDLLSYLDSYIHGNSEMDILKETLNVPGWPNEPTNLDNLSSDFPMLTQSSSCFSQNCSYLTDHINTYQSINNHIQADRYHLNEGVPKSAQDHCATSQQSEYTSDHCKIESKICNLDNSNPSCPNIVGQNEASLVPIDPLLTLKDTNCKEKIIQNMLVDTATVDDIIEDKNLDELISSIVNNMHYKSQMALDRLPEYALEKNILL